MIGVFFPSFNHLYTRKFHLAHKLLYGGIENKRFNNLQEELSMNYINLLGPTATISEHKLLTAKPGNMEIEKMQGAFKERIKKKHAHLEYDLESLTKLQQDETKAFEVLHQRGVKLNVDVFVDEMNLVIENYQLAGKQNKAHQQKMRRDKIQQMHPQTDVIHPTFSTKSSRTGRLTVSKPALQSWKSSVRTALSPSVEGYEHVYSLDCKAYDPTVLAALSKDENLIKDLNSDDFYLELLQHINHSDKTTDSRNAMKHLFLACFINGGDVSYHLQQSALTLTKEQWQKVEDRYAVALKYRNDIEQTGVAYSLNGITYLFKPNDTAKFSKFIQHEAAYIFRHIFLNVFNQESALDIVTVLPIHDELMIGSRDPRQVDSVCKIMKKTFQTVTGTDILKVSVTHIGGEQYE